MFLGVHNHILQDFITYVRCVIFIDIKILLFFLCIASAMPISVTIDCSTKTLQLKILYPVAGVLFITVCVLCYLYIFPLYCLLRSKKERQNLELRTINTRTSLQSENVFDDNSDDDDTDSPLIPPDGLDQKEFYFLPKPKKTNDRGKNDSS